MLLNCDLGETIDNGTDSADARVMPYIDQANIACGFHAGDAHTMQRTLALAAKHGVSVGAHPAYPDLEGFGRCSVPMSTAQIINIVHYQVAALDGMAQSQGLVLAHIKPHGALYNDMMVNTQVRGAILQALASYHRPITLILQATSAADRVRFEAATAGVAIQLEAFADRRYTDNGLLQSRQHAGAVLDTDEMLAQVQQLLEQHSVTSSSGATIALQADTLCVHGDNEQAVAAIAQIRALVTGA